MLCAALKTAEQGKDRSLLPISPTIAASVSQEPMTVVIAAAADLEMVRAVPHMHVHHYQHHLVDHRWPPLFHSIVADQAA